MLTKDDALALLGKKPQPLAVPSVVEEKDPVRSQAQIATLSLRKKAIRVQLEIEQGWYVYGKPLAFPFLVPLSVDIRGSAIQEVLEIRFPPPTRQYDRTPATLYQRKVTVEAKVLLKKDVPAESTLRVLLRYQACSRTGSCLSPVNRAYRVSV